MYDSFFFLYLSLVSLLRCCRLISLLSFFFFNATATTEIYTLSLHDALPISPTPDRPANQDRARPRRKCRRNGNPLDRSEEHTSELQSHINLVCRLLLEKKKKKQTEKS